MYSPRFPRSIYFALVAVLALQGFIYFPKLPDRMASHFDGAGLPNGYQSKEMFFLMLYGILFAISALLAYAVPALISSKPEITNLPNKGYWLAPERRAATLDFLTAHFAWMGCAILAFGNVVLYLIVRFHLEHQTTLSSTSMWIALLAFLTFVLSWMVAFFRRMSLPS
jgi:uncharacterized membrane protein